MAKTVAEQSKTAQVNSFTGGLNTDLHPMLQPNDTLTDCLNGTLITYNGNENMLQNDMGNYELKNAKLPEGYVPMGMKEHQGVLYMILMNPITKKVQIGSYPSPQTIFEKSSEAEEFELHPIDIGTIGTFSDPEEEAKAVWDIVDEISENPVDKHLYTKLDLSNSSTIFTKDYSDNSTLGYGDRYLLNKENIDEETPFQTLQYFSIDSNKNMIPIQDNQVLDVANNIDVVDSSDSDEYNDVLWNSKGWLGARYVLDEATEIKHDLYGEVNQVIDNIYISGVRKTTDLTEDWYKNGNILSYEFSIKGLTGKNAVFDFENQVCNNTENVFMQLREPFNYYNKSVKKYPWKYACYLEGPNDAPFYKFDNENFYSSGSEQGNRFFDEDFRTNYLNTKAIAQAVVLSPSKGFGILAYLEAKYYYISGDLWDPTGESASKQVRKLLQLIVSEENRTIVFSHSCTKAFKDLFDGYFDTSTNNNLSSGNIDDVIENTTDRKYTHITNSELETVYNNRTIRVYLSEEVDNWGLNGEFEESYMSRYTYSETDWQPAIKWIDLYSAKTIHPNRSDTVIIRGYNREIIAPNISVLLNPILYNYYGNDTSIYTQHLAEYSDGENTQVAYFKIEVPENSSLGAEFASRFSMEYRSGYKADTPLTPFGENIPSSKPNESTAPKYDELFDSEYYEIYKLFIYQFKIGRLFIEIPYMHEQKLMTRCIESMKFVENDQGIILTVDINISKFIQRYSNLFTGEKDPKNSIIQGYLYGGFQFAIGECVIFPTLTNDFIISGERILSLIPINTDGKTYYYEFSSESDGKYVVPESFNGTIGETSFLPDGVSEWNDSMKATYEKVDMDVYGTSGNIYISAAKSSDIKIATKVTCDGVAPKYYNISFGEVIHSFEIKDDKMQNITIESVPYKIDDLGYCIIYDNLKIVDTVNYFENHESRISSFVYNREGNKINVKLSTTHSMNFARVINSIDVHYFKDNLLCWDKDVYLEYNAQQSTNYGTAIEFSIVLKEGTYIDDFIFLYIALDEDDSVILPLYTSITSDKRNELESKGYKDFSQLYIDQIKDGYSKIPEECIQNSDNNGIKYVTAKCLDDGSLNIIHESDNEYYWYNALSKKDSQTDEVLSDKYYFGKIERVSSKINLTALGIESDDVISIKGIPNKNYDNITVTKSNVELFSVEEDSNIYLNIDALSSYNLTSYHVEGSETPIAVRNYLIKHGFHPITHSDTDLGWTYNAQLSKYAKWSEYKPQLFKMLYVTKADSTDASVCLNVIDQGIESFSAESETYDKGVTITNVSEANNKIWDIVGKDHTTQLFTLVKASLDSDKGGFIIPVPRMQYGTYDYSCTKNKKNKGTSSAVVLTRDADGLQWANKLKDVIAYTGIVGGIGAIAALVVMGCIAAYAAAGAAAAALAAIPFVGWAILAAAAIAASIYLLCKVTAGVDKEFEFYAMKGPNDRPLVIPLWGSHAGRCNNKGKVKHKWGYIKGVIFKKMDKHPWYLDNDFTYAEELMTYIMTHLYYYVPGPNLQLKKDGDTRSHAGISIKICTNSTSELYYDVKKYTPIFDLLTSTNNFIVQNKNASKTLEYSNSGNTVIPNDFDVASQDIKYITEVNRYECFHDSLDKVNTWEYYDPAVKSNIDSEMDSFRKNIKIEISGDFINVYYGGDIRTNIQDAFGGSPGGRVAKFQCPAEGVGSSVAMISGEFPRNDKDFIPIAWGVGAGSDDMVMVKDYGWNAANSDWGVSKSNYTTGPNPEDKKKGSKYYDYIQWGSYTDNFKLTVNTNEI